MISLLHTVVVKLFTLICYIYFNLKFDRLQALKNKHEFNYTFLQVSKQIILRYLSTGNIYTVFAYFDDGKNTALDLQMTLR